jgi:4-hydroxy-tetrahydrodipicolinate synthase
MTVFRGLIAYPVTPFLPDGAINFDELERHLSELAVSGVDSIAILGSSGSFAYLNRAERRQVLETGLEAIKTANPDLAVIGGVSAVGTRELLLNIEDAQAAGVDGLLVSAMSYVPLNEDEVHTQSLAAAASTALPICLYSNPGTTQFSFSLELIAELARVRNIVAVKESAADTDTFLHRDEQLRRMVPEGFSHGMSGDVLIGEAGAAADAWHSGPASVLPHHYRLLRDAAVNGDTDKLAEARQVLAPLLNYFNSLRKLSNLYALARAAGVDAGDPRRPLLPLPGSSQRELARLLDALPDPASV